MSVRNLVRQEPTPQEVMVDMLGKPQPIVFGTQFCQPVNDHGKDEMLTNGEQLLSARVQLAGSFDVGGPFSGWAASSYYTLKDHQNNRYLKISPFEREIINLLNEVDYVEVGDLLDWCLSNGYISDIRDFFITLFRLQQVRLVTIGGSSSEQNRGNPKVLGRSSGHYGTTILWRFAKAFVFTRLGWQQVDGFISSSYKYVGRILFARFALLAFLTLMIVGMMLLFFHISTYGFSVLYKPPLRLLGVFYFSGIIISFFHELAHALACKHFGYRVKEAGVAIYYGVLIFYVSLTDMWLAKPRQRIWAMVAGPFSTFLMGALAAIAGSLVSSREWHDALYQLAIFSCVGAVFALNPLMEWDGYYILVDVLGIPNLRQKAFRFLYEWVAKKKACLTQDERIMLSYAFLAGFWTLMTILMSVWAWAQYVKHALGGSFVYYFVPLALLLLMVVRVSTRALHTLGKQKCAG